MVRSGTAAHPDGTEVDPAPWWDALGQASGAGRPERHRRRSRSAPSSTAWSPSTPAGEVVRPALLWNDIRSAPQARDMVERLGAQAWADAVGSVPLPAFTVTKVAWLAEHEPDHAAAVASVLLPHDWLTWRLLGQAGRADDGPQRRLRHGLLVGRHGTTALDLFEQALGHPAALPRVLGPAERAGRSGPTGVVLGPGAGDNAAAALGPRACGPGEVAVSLGTSGAIFAATDLMTHDGTGIVAGFADATGRQLPLCCTLNAARVLTATATHARHRPVRPGSPCRRRGSGGRRPDPAALSGRRAHARPARLRGQPAWPAPGQHDAGQPGPRRRPGHAVRAGRRPGCHAGQRSSRPSGSS